MRLLQSLKRNKMAGVGLAIIAAFVIMAVFAPVLAPFNPFDPEQCQIEFRLTPPLVRTSSGSLFVLGTDYLGRDLLSRLIYGSRVSLLVGILATVLSGLVGSVLGLLSGLYGSYVDTIIMRVADVQLAFPFIFLAVVAAAMLTPSAANITMILAFTGWVRFARLVRGEVLALREREFVEAARAVGLSGWQVMTRHLVPHTMSSIIVLGTLELSRMIIMEASLGFLGLGVPPPTPTFGGMLSDGRAYLTRAWWVAFFPGLAISLPVLGINLVGDWLRDFFDPRLEMER